MKVEFINAVFRSIPTFLIPEPMEMKFKLHTRSQLDCVNSPCLEYDRIDVIDLLLLPM
jgi:hypothetical protein